jgi:hypothetical protein
MDGSESLSDEVSSALESKRRAKGVRHYQLTINHASVSLLVRMICPDPNALITPVLDTML